MSVFVFSFVFLCCSGVVDLVVGAYGDVDSQSGSGGSNLGAVYVLFLNRNGTVKGEQKISDTQGGFEAGLDSSDFFGYSVASIGDLNNE